MIKLMPVKKCRINVGNKYRQATWWLNFLRAHRKKHLIQGAFCIQEGVKFSLDEFYNNALRPYNGRLIMFGSRQCIEFDSEKDYTFFVMKWS